VKPSSIVLLVGLVLALVPITSTLWAFAQGDGFDIHACVNPGGQIRIVDDLSMCRKQETELEWNIQGPQGEPALTGVLGFYTVSHWRSVPADEFSIIDVQCDAGDQVSGGGFEIDDFECVVHVESMPIDETYWRSHISNHCDPYVYHSASARCADFDPPHQ
jgi:hypothetical protein